MMDFSRPPEVVDEVLLQQTEGDIIYILKIASTLLFSGTAFDLVTFKEDLRRGDPPVSIVLIDLVYLKEYVTRVFSGLMMLNYYSQILQTDQADAIDYSASGIADFGDALEILMIQESLSKAFERLKSSEI